jgi:ferredoxin-NADP reductase
VINGKEYKRSYSLASTPSQQGIIEITVKRDANGGVVSNWLNDNLKIGDTLSLKGPFGKFTCAKETPMKILFLAAGSGIVPIMSMLRWLTGTETQIDIVLLLSFRTNIDIIYRKEFELIASRHRNIRLFVTLTKQPQATGQRRVLTGRMNKSWIAEAVPDLTERAVYLCGPDGFMTVCRQYLQELKHPEERLFCESFCIDNLNHSIQQLDKTLSPPARATGSYQVKFARSGLQITTDGRTNLLVLAENSGVKISHECRSGSCGECMIKSLEGKVDLAYQAEIDEIDRKKGWVYACCAYPASNVTLDI